MPETPLKPAQPKRPFVGSLNEKTDGMGLALVPLGSRDLNKVVSNPLPPPPSLYTLTPVVLISFSSKNDPQQHHVFLVHETWVQRRAFLSLDMGKAWGRWVAW